MNGDRQAALALHRLGEADRRWVLSTLAREQVARVLPLLKELKSLGIPTSAPDSESDDVAGRPFAQPVGPASPIERIRAASAEQMVAALADEPAYVIAALLSVEPFPWRDAFLARLPSPKRRCVEQGARRGVGDCLGASLAAAVNRRLAETAGTLRIQPRVHALHGPLRMLAALARGAMASWK